MIKKIFKSVSSIVLSLVVLVTTFCFDVSIFAEIQELTLPRIANATNSIVSLFATDLQEECDHDYQVFSTTGTPTCTKKAYITYKCSYCGVTKRQYAAYGHMYEYVSDAYRAFNYTCSVCKAKTTTPVPVEQCLAIFENNINKAPIRNNDNMYLDVVNDDVINGKDYAKLVKNSEYRLTNPNADETTQRIYKYICEINGKQTLSAQQESTWMGSPDYEINYIYNNTGKYPAMRGLDYMNDDFNGVNKRAIAWWKKGGLVTICWHTGSDFTGEWNDASNDVVADWTQMLTPGTNEYNAMIAGMDKAAKALLELQKNGVTVLWRPFHEFDGGWFWWGKGTAKNFTDLWKIMYDRYTNYWGLNNLIWVLGYSHVGTSSNAMPAWNPGEDYYDIMGADTYDDTEFLTLYQNVNKIVANGKPVCLHECGKNPTEAQLLNNPYCYFMTWHTNYITSDNTTGALNTLYSSNRVITLDELDY